MKTARTSFGKNYDCKYDWEENCFCQAGGNGVVISKDGPYNTAFFEAFPKTPSTFIRGQGATIEEAEKEAWDEWLKIKACQKHEFERRGYTNGLGFCKHCNMSSSKAFEPSTICKFCGKPTNYAHLNDNEMCCKECRNDYDKVVSFMPDYMIDMFASDGINGLFSSPIDESTSAKILNDKFETSNEIIRVLDAGTNRYVAEKMKRLIKNGKMVDNADDLKAYLISYYGLS